jgi:hypothetical protein
MEGVPMSHAVVVAFTDLRAQQVRREVREHLHAQFDTWLDDLEDWMPHQEAPVTLATVTQAVLAARQELTGAIVTGLIEHTHAEVLAQHTAPCPHCGRELLARGTPRRTVETLVGEVHLERPYFYCVACCSGFSPLDAVLELSSDRKQPDLRRAGARLAAEVPYATAAELMLELTGVSLTEPPLHETVAALTKGVTVLEVCPTAEEVQQQITQVAAGNTWRPILVLAIDGADVPTRPETAKGTRQGRKHRRATRRRWTGEWREAKGFRAYLVDGDRIVHLFSWHQVQSDQEVGAALQQVRQAGLIPEERVRLCVVADGASWIWTWVTALFPTAVQVLDYYHCTEHLYATAVAQFAHAPEQQVEWMEATLARLFAGDVQAVLASLQHMATHPDAAVEALTALSTYLTHHQDRVTDGFAQKGGYPLGSGGIESAHKFIAHVRLKRSGAWWYVENANSILVLRCARYNGTFDRLFETYLQKTRQSRITGSCKK